MAEVAASDLWALLAGPRGYLAVSYRGGTAYVDCGDPRRFGRVVGGLVWEREPMLGAVPRLDPDERFRGSSSVLWARVESKTAEARLGDFRVPPTLVLREGRGARLTALWGLSGVLGPEMTRRLNRRLANHLGTTLKTGDPDNFWFSPPGAVLRSGRKRPVVTAVESWTGELHSTRDVAGGLADPVEWVWDPAEGKMAAA